MKKYLLALDEGTTSVRAILFDKLMNIIAVSQHEFTQIYPQPGYVEHDAMEIYANQYAAMTECIAKSGISPSEIAGIGITNQRETTVVWDKATGKPICNAIVWQCRRTADICRKAISDGMEEIIRQKTGLRIDAYFSATKLRWILDHTEGARERAEKGELLFGTIDTWLLWKLTEGTVHATDHTNASRTMLYNLKTAQWDDELLEYFGIPQCMMPEIRSSSEIFGNVSVMGKEIPICGIAGDQQGLITTAAASEKGKPLEYALEGSVFIGGAVIQWLRDGAGLLRESADSEYFASKVSDSGGVYVVPAFTGLGAPYWNMNARGTITGLTRGTGINHLIRASLEAIAYQTNDLLEAMKADTGGDISVMKADGGAAANNLLMQFQSDISALTVVRPVSGEATAAGAAFLAGLAAGFFSGREEISELCKSGRSFEPEMTKERRAKLLGGWKKAVQAALTFAQDED